MESQPTVAEPSDPTDASVDAISDAESVLDNLLDVVRSQSEDILAAARAEAAVIRAQAESERAQIVAAARVEAAELVDSALAELSAVDSYRDGLQQLAAQLRSGGTPAAESVEPVAVDEASVETDREDEAFVEVEPEALLLLAGELGVDSCRDVVDTFLVELKSQLEYLNEASKLEDASLKTIGRVLHNLSSGCATVGAYDVAELCNEIAADELATNIDRLSERATIVYDEVERIRNSELAGSLDDGGAGENAG